MFFFVVRTIFCSVIVVNYLRIFVLYIASVFVCVYLFVRGARGTGLEPFVPPFPLG